MIRSAVTVSLVSEARGGPFVLWDDLPEACRLAGNLGFDAIEVFPPSASVIDARELHCLLDEHRLKLAAVGTGAGWVVQRMTLTNPEEGIRKSAREFVQSIIDFAGPFGAPAIIGSMQGRYGGEVDRLTALGYLSDALAYLAEYACSTYHVPLLIEPLNRYETNLLNTLDDGVRLVRQAGTTNVKLLADLFHLNIEEEHISASLRATAPHLGHVHFVDSNRRPVGCGHLDLAPIATVLRDVGYDGYASAEALPYPTSVEAAQRTIEAFRAYFRKT